MLRRALIVFGEFILFSATVLRRVFSPRYTTRELIGQMHRIGVESVNVVNLCAFFIGLVLVMQTHYQLARFGAKAEVAKIVSAAFVREIGPVFAAIMFAGRIGTGITAELGSMVVTEQIDAYRAFGSDPVGKLATPRVLATALMLPALTAVADVVGIFSGFLLAVTQMGLSGEEYLHKCLDSLTRLDVISSIAKGAVFGLGVGLVSTFIGFHTRRATEAVGQATTHSMVASVLVVLFADLVMTNVFLSLE